MRQILNFVLGTGLTLCGISTVIAGSMNCGTNIIEDGQLQGQTKTEIRGLCGEPNEANMDNWLYVRDGSKYRLHFNGNGELESIIEE